MIIELVFSLALLIIKTDGSTTVLKMNKGSENSSSVLMSEANHTKYSLRLTAYAASSTVSISFFNVPEAAHDAFLACLHAKFHCEAACRSKVCCMCD